MKVLDYQIIYPYSKIESDKIYKVWFQVLERLTASSKMGKLLERTNMQYLTWAMVPKRENIFKAFELCPYYSLKVVILVDGLYSNDGSTGLALAQPAHYREQDLEPALKVVKDTVNRTVYKDYINHELTFDQTLKDWALQGVLLLNTSLTTRIGWSGYNHSDWFWFTRGVLEILNEKNSGLIYLLWGKDAKKYEKYIRQDTNIILKAPHPMNTFITEQPWTCNHFNQVNEMLNSNKKIIW